jgi:uncharacterized protein (DUF2249 family)
MMVISSKTKISKLIESNNDTIEVISSINKHFRKLKNPILRRTLASRVSIEDAAKIGGVPICVMIDRLKEIGFVTEDDCACDMVSADKMIKRDKNKINMKKETIVELDVRPILEAGTDPFESIMAELKKMDEKHTLLIINKFEPIPLLNILKTKGYNYQTERPEDGVVHTFVEKMSGDIKPEERIERVQESSFEQVEKKYEGKMKEIDVRHLEMPMPMVTILEEIEHIGAANALFVHHKKLPQYLIPELEDRNYQWVSNEIDESNVKLIIFK